MDEFHFGAFGTVTVFDSDRKRCHELHKDFSIRRRHNAFTAWPVVLSCSVRLEVERRGRAAGESVGVRRWRLGCMAPPFWGRLSDCIRPDMVSRSKLWWVDREITWRSGEASVRRDRSGRYRGFGWASLGWLSGIWPFEPTRRLGSAAAWGLMGGS